MLILSPSLLSVDFNHIADHVACVKQAGAPYLHLDVMDGVFVPNISFGPPVIRCIRQITDQILDVHLMIEEPIRYLEDYQACGVDFVTVHAEACRHLNSTVSKIKSLGMKAGVALNPATPLSVLEYVLEDVDMILVMSVNPGFAGQAFIPSSIEKIRNVKQMLLAKNLHTDIQVDGGVTLDNVKEVIEAGANVIVAGSAVFRGDSSANVKAFLDIFKEYQS